MTRFAIIAVLVLTVAGCSIPTKRWPHANREYVWIAMIAAAKTPDYSSDDPRKRWIVIENDVDVNSDLGRIVVNRKLSRLLLLPRQNEQIDTREWFFVIQLKPETSSTNQKTTVTFDVPESQFIPVRVQDEADRYFSLVDELLQPAE